MPTSIMSAMYRENRLSKYLCGPERTPKLQRNSKSQTPNFENKCRGQCSAGRFLSLELGASLELGVWDLELVAWALSGLRHKYDDVRGKGFFAQTRRERRAYPAVDL